jgi:hypothetical protein
MSPDAPLSSSTTIPSSPNINTSASDPLPPKPARNSTVLRHLYTLLYRYIIRLARKADANILRLSILLSKPAGTDALLCTVGYLLDLHSTLLSRYLSRTLTATLTTKSDVVLPPTPLHIQRLENIRVGSKALASVISDFRIFVRLWGLVGIYTWARSTYTSPSLSSASTRTERVLRGITWTQVLAGIAFQVLENGAYLASKGVIWSDDEGKRREVRWWVWSSRFWAAHVGLEFLRLGLEARARASISKKEKEIVNDGEKEGKIRREDRRRENWAWWRYALSNVAYAPMTLHWSVEEGLLSELGVSVLGTIAGGMLLVDKWKGTK